MRSSKYEYRLIQKPDGKFSYQYRHLLQGGWDGGNWTYATKEEAKSAAIKAMKDDDFCDATVIPWEEV